MVIIMNDNIFIFPTDTVYGIGCRLYDSEAIKVFMKLKAETLTNQLVYYVLQSIRLKSLQK